MNYLQVGTIIIADDLNEIKAHMEDERLHQLYELPTASALQKGGIRPGNGLTMIGDLLTVTLASGASSVDVAEHNDSSAAHPYIQNLLGDEIAARIQAVADLERRIESLELRLGGGLMFDSDGVLQLKLGEGLALDADGFLNVTVAAAVNDDPAVWLKSQQLGVETDTDNSLAECAAHWNLEAVTYDYQVLRFNDTYAAIALPAVFANRSYGSDYKFFYPPDNDVLYNCADRYVEGSDFGGLIEIPASEVAVSECQPTHHHWVTISQSICNALKWYSEDAGAYNTDFFLFVKE